jgi:hypothetical protein
MEWGKDRKKVNGERKLNLERGRRRLGCDGGGVEDGGWRGGGEQTLLAGRWRGLMVRTGYMGEGGEIRGKVAGAEGAGSQSRHR